MKRIFLTYRWLFLGLATAVGVNLIPLPEGLTPQGLKAIALLSMVVIFFATEGIPLIATAFMIAAYQVLTGITSFHELPKTFMHDSVFFIMGTLMISTVLIKYGIHQRIFLKLFGHVGTKIKWIVFTLIATCALSSAFISEHATASLMLPIGMSFLSLTGKKQTPQLAKLLMISISYGCMIGSIASPAGGTRNVLMIDYMREYANTSIGFGQWIINVMPLTLLLIPITFFVLWTTFSPEVKNLTQNPREIAKKFKSLETTPLKANSTLGLFILTLVGWIFFGSKYGIGQIAMMTATLYLILGLIKWKDYHEQVNWQVIWLYAACISLGQCLIDTGAATWLAFKMIGAIQNGFGISGGLFLVMAVGFIAMLMTNTMAAGPAIAAVGPIILKIGDLAGMSPIVMGLSAAIFSSFGFILMVGHPASLIVYGSGFLETKDFFKGGPLLSILALLLVTFVGAGVYWKILGVF